MEIYNRQETIDMKTDIKVAIVGLGGVGYWVAKFIAMSGVKELYLFDNDILEIHNLNRLDLPIEALGTNKADAAKYVIKSIRPAADVESIPFEFKPDFLRAQVDVMIDCTDKIESQKQIYAYSRDKNIKYVKVGYDGTHITVSNKIASWGEDVDGYVITPSWVVPAVVVAAMAVGAVLKYMGREISANVYDLYKAI